MATPHDKLFNHMPDERSGSVGGYSAAQIEAMRPMMPQAPAPQFPPVMPQAPKPSSPVDDRFNSLAAAIESVVRQVATLEKSLEPVLTPPYSEVCGEAPRPAAPPCSPMVDRLSTLERTVNQVIDSVQSIVDRVEL